MDNCKKRSGNIEFLRFIFSVCIVLHHAMINKFAMWGGVFGCRIFLYFKWSIFRAIYNDKK